MAGRTELNHEEIDFLASRMAAGAAWADAVTAFNLAYPGVDAAFLAAREAEVTAMSLVRAASFTPASTLTDIAYLENLVTPAITSCAALTTTGKLDTTEPTPFKVVGEGFVPGCTVTVDGVAATGVTVVNRKLIHAVAPAHAAGVVDVVVTNPNTLTDTDAGGIEYATLAPNYTSLHPAKGHIYGGGVVAIVGSDFLAGTTVLFDATPATSVVVHSQTLITCKAPAHAAGAVAVTVRAANTSTVVAAASYTYA